MDEQLAVSKVTKWPQPWPIEKLIARLESGSELHRLIRERQKIRGYDLREFMLERLAHGVMAEHFGAPNAFCRCTLGSLLGVRQTDFPYDRSPDVVIKDEAGRLHVCELKSNRTDYPRFDRVVAPEMKRYFEHIGHAFPPPWEVEQDLVKLHLYKDHSSMVGSCIFFMVDAYLGDQQPRWSDVFQDPKLFRNRMCTRLVQGWADELVSSTRVIPISTDGAAARVIVCTVRAEEQKT